MLSRRCKCKPFYICQVILLTKTSLEEADVLNGDIYGLIAPYATANFWVSQPHSQHGAIFDENLQSGGHLYASSTTDTMMLSQRMTVLNKDFNPPSR
jgi:hypothetical protein